MKFLHLGDLHLGRFIGEFDLIEDQKYILDQILDIAGRNDINYILIAGDVYDKSIPSEAAVRLFDFFYAGLPRGGSRHLLLAEIMILMNV